MISFNAFVRALHSAVNSASDSLMDKNVGLLDKYFKERTVEVPATDGKEKETKSILDPKTVILVYPSIDKDGNEQMNEVHVPLVTLVPLRMSQVEKATVTADFDIQVNGDEIELSFPKKSGGLFGKKPNTAKLEITITPHETAAGLKMLVEGYESVIKRQIS